MDIHAQLVAVVDEAKSASQALISATRVIAEALDAEACTIFVRQMGNGLELRAHHGPPPDPLSWDAPKALAMETLGNVLPRRGAGTAAGIVAVPVAAINHAVGAMVVWRAASPFTAEEIMRLSGVASQLVGIIESARLIETIARARTTLEHADGPSEPARSTGERVLRGVAASPGIAIGATTFRNTLLPAFLDRDTAHRGVDSERARVRDAMQKTRNDLDRLQSAAASEIGEEHALIFGAQLLLLSDPMLRSLVDQEVTAGRSAPVAIDHAFDEIVRRLGESRDAYIQERVDDIEDLRGRILSHILGAERQSDVDARVIVSVRTTPSLVLELKARGALGIASELGGAISHGALLARALGVPAVTGIARISHEVDAGDLVVIDGGEGIVVIRPTPKTRAEYERRRQASERKRTEFLRFRDAPPTTADGMRFQLQANIALGADLKTARENRADGIGLYRTEFPFMVRDALPTVDEQVRIYSKAYAAFPAAPVTLRLLDLAGDKFLTRSDLGVARDAFHGYRSIRVLFDYPHVLRDQVCAFAIAAAGKDLRILIPMVTSVEDVVRVKHIVAASLAESSRARACASVSYGAMVETPAAVEIVADLASEVDFFSVGTNDLVQYALVVDREDPRMMSERHAYHPAILRMIRRVTTQANHAGKQVTVCGEMAARPNLAIALLALGVDTLSVTPGDIPELKQSLARVPVAPLRACVDEFLATSTAEGVEGFLRRYARTEGG